jgi:hypothetical protein
LELELHRPVIRKLDIGFPVSFSDLEIDYSRFFEFRRIDAERLYKYVAKKNRKRCAKLNKERLKNEQMPLIKGGGDILLRQTEEWVGYLDSLPLMEAVEYMKSKLHSVPNYSRFLVPMDGLNNLIQKVANKQRFGLQ